MNSTTPPAKTSSMNVSDAMRRWSSLSRKYTWPQIRYGAANPLRGRLGYDRVAIRVQPLVRFMDRFEPTRID